MSKNAKPLVCLLAAPETSAAVLYGLFDVLGTVGGIYAEMTSKQEVEPLLDVRIVASDNKPFRCFGNILVEPSHSLEAIDRADVVVVCDMYQPVDQPPAGRYQDEIAWIKKMHAGGALICSVCSGSIILAEAGLLDDMETAGHWAYRDLFRRHYPTVKMREQSILCLSGEEQGIVTSGAVTSWQDLVIYIINRLCGPEEALKSTKIYLLADRSDGQLPFSNTTAPLQVDDAIVARGQRWFLENIAANNPVQAMAEVAEVSPRTYARRFRQATGMQPIDYVQRTRVEEAKQHLETGQDSIEDIALSVGYEDPASFRRLFKRLVGLTPAAYRKKFFGLVA